MDSTKIKILVADTTAFINNVNLHDYAERVITVPDVIKEVKNTRQIRRLAVLPFDLEVIEPESDNLTHVIDFAKKTGDYASLSLIDMKVIALTFELHKNNEGTSKLRTEPVASQIIASKEKPVELLNNSKLPGFYEGKYEPSIENHVENTNKEEENSTVDLNIFKETEVIQIENGENSVQELKDNDNSEDEDIDLLKSLNELNLDDKSDELLSVIKKSESEEESCEESGEGSENESDWITPSMIKKMKGNDESSKEEVPVVACMTTDFAIQNVLKQINLNICALDGRVIKYLKTYILRCYSCFKTTSIMTKVFCPNCGNKTLKRVSVSLDKDGKQVIHINTKRPLTTKFKNQPLPRPRGGKHSRNAIVVEDQPLPRQMPSRVAKTKTQPLEENYIAGYSPFATRDLNSKSALLRSKGHIKEWAQNNYFEEQRRKKYFSRLVK